MKKLCYSLAWSNFIVAIVATGCAVRPVILQPPAAAIAPPIPYAQARLSGTRVIREKCVRCHSGPSAPNGLDLSTREGIFKGGKRGPAVIPYKPHESLVWQAVTANGDVPIMPPFDRLADDEIEAIRIGIDHGWQTVSMGGQEP